MGSELDELPSALVEPDRDGHVEAAEPTNSCRRKGAQIGTIHTLLAQLCMRHNLTMPTDDDDFTRVAEHSRVKLWAQA